MIPKLNGLVCVLCLLVEGDGRTALKVAPATTSTGAKVAPILKTARHIEELPVPSESASMMSVARAESYRCRDTADDESQPGGLGSEVTPATVSGSATRTITPRTGPSSVLPYRRGRASKTGRCDVTPADISPSRAHHSLTQSTTRPAEDSDTGTTRFRSSRDSELGSRGSDDVVHDIDDASSHHHRHASVSGVSR